jgi:copper chaperone NosL
MLRCKKIIIVFSGIFLFACGSQQPEPIHYGVDACNFCRMTIVDPKWGAEIITDKGKTYKFDVVECMIAYYYTKIDTNKVRSMFTIDFTNPGNFIEAKQAKFIQTLQFPSPMGLNVISLKTYADTTKMGLKSNYEMLDWWGVVKKVKNEILE